jgi:signal transduction histidine kinase
LKLLHKAIKYSTPNAYIFITASRNKQQALISIRDQGSGIPEANLPRIFEQFYTTSHSTKQTGVGLGLAIARRIIEAHGGSITANSKPGQGAVFTLSLPLES